MDKNKWQSGVVSLFTVLFTTLLLTVLTVSFLRLMLQEQQQAQNQDLSQSAYDSAISGVEDAKRVLRACQQQGATSDACKAIDAQQCWTIQDAGIVSSLPDSETIIKSGSSATDTAMNQAYTCVKITRDSADYLGSLYEGKSTIVPLKALGKFNKVVVQWMHHNDASSGGMYLGGNATELTAPLSPDVNYQSLPPQSDWSASAPAALRALAVLPANPSNVTLAELDGPTATTVLLRPIMTAASKDKQAVDTVVPVMNVRSAENAGGRSTPSAIECSNYLFANDDYACQTTLTMPAGKYVPEHSTVAFLRLTSLYRDTSFRITLYDDATSVLFDGVQPSVDSTGRASNIYRRVSSRINIQAESILSPDAALTATGNICKDFYITDSSAQGYKCQTAPSTLP